MNGTWSKAKSIVTVGLCPCWDITCRVGGVNWGSHQQLSSQECLPAGKALNVSLGLAQLGRANIAAGLWGRLDYGEMVGCMAEIAEVVNLRLTVVEGQTRHNVTIVDTELRRELHLRAPSELASVEVLERLSGELEGFVVGGDICVFAGSMPKGEGLERVVGIVRSLQERGARIVLDTSGGALRKIAGIGGIWLVKPNVMELGKLVGREVEDEEKALAEACKELGGKVETTVVSRGREGAVAVRRECAAVVRAKGERDVLSTVGCGDYLLAGFLDGLLEEDDIVFGLERGVRLATAKAWGMLGDKPWSEVEGEIKVETERL